MIENRFGSARRSGGALVSSALAIALVACGGKVVFVEAGAGGGASTSSSTNGLGGNAVSSPTSAMFAATTASFMNTSANTSAVDSTSTGTSSTCDGSGDCNACQSCALEPQAQCYDALMSCYDSPPCAMLLKCYQTCTNNDQSCYNACYTMNMNGGDAYQALGVCVLCDACTNDCSSQGGQTCTKGD